MPPLVNSLPSSRLFWRLFASNAIVIPAAALVFLAIATRWHQQQVVAQVDVRLHDVAVSARESVERAVASGDVEALRDLTQRIGQETETRMTVIQADGLVLADSQEHADRMNNHSNRPEFITAMKVGEGRSERVSPTLGIAMRYYAVSIQREGATYCLLRTALPVAKTRTLARSLQPLLWITALLGSLIGCLFGYYNARTVTDPVNRLAAAADRIAAGDYQQPVMISSDDEMGHLAQSFNRMNREMSTRESQLRDTADKLATVLGGMVEGVLAVDVDHRIQFANRAAGLLLGFNVNRVHRGRLLDIVRNQTLRQLVVMALDEKADDDGNRVVDEITAGPDGKLTLAVQASRLPGKPCPGVVLVLHDVTELRRLEQMRQEFVANVSHELKTPLSAIMAYAETLKQGALDDPSVNRSFVENIHEQSLRLQDLIMDMLQLARIESDQQAFEIESVAILPVIEACLAERQAIAESQGIQLFTEEGIDPKLRTIADEEGLRQILDNLVDNAIKYTPTGGRVTVRGEQEDAFVAIRVADTGIGIAKEDQPRIFERFYRVDKARSRELGSTGLGLSIVKHLTQSFQGQVELESELGVGSVFTVRLPLGEPELQPHTN